VFKLNPIYLNFPHLKGDLESFEEDPNLVFVLMPFGRSATEKNGFNHLYQALKRIIEEGCFQGGRLKCSRADLEDGQIIMDDICRQIKKAGLTVFDISIPNLNVYYELGLACALDKKFLLTYNHSLYYEEHSPEKIPFDIGQFRHVEYSSLKDLEPKLKKKIETLIGLKDYSQIDIQKVYEKVKKITRHFNLETKAEQIKEDSEISDYDIERVSSILGDYLDNPKLEANGFKGIKYIEIELKIRKKLGTNNHEKIKDILQYIYWSGYYQQLIVNLELLPAEFYEVRRDYEQREKQDN